MNAVVVWIAILTSSTGIYSPSLHFPREADCQEFVNQVYSRSIANNRTKHVAGICSPATIIPNK